MAAAAAASAMPAGATTGPQTVSPDRNAAGKALVLVPLTLTKIDDLDFGTIIPSATSGFVTINATSGARSFGGGVSGAASAAGHRAYFGGAGTPSQQVIITIDAPTEISLAVGANGMKVSTTGVEISGAMVKSTATSGPNEISGLMVKLN